MARKARSPKYPRMALAEAIERVRQVHRAEHTHKADKEVIAKDLGYGSLNGASVTLIGTLKNYGLLLEDQEGIKVSEDAVVALMAPEESHERAQALQRLAFTPRVFADLRDTYGDEPDRLPSDTTLRYYLVKKGFLEKAAGEAVRTYRDNLEFVSEVEAEYTAADEPVDEQPMEVEVEPQPPRSSQPAPHHSGINTFAPAVSAEQEAATEVLQYRISGDSRVRLLFDGVVTKEAIEKLRKYLELAADDYPSKDQLKSPAVEQSVERPAIEMPAPEQAAVE